MALPFAYNTASRTGGAPGADFGLGPSKGDPMAPHNKRYRPDMGRNMTDAEYNAAKGFAAQQRERDAMKLDQEREKFSHGLREQSADSAFRRENQFATQQHQWNVDAASTAHQRAVQMLKEQMGYKAQFMDKEFQLSQTAADNNLRRDKDILGTRHTQEKDLLGTQFQLGERGKNSDAERQAAAEARRLQMFQPFLDQMSNSSWEVGSGPGGAGAVPETIDMDISGLTAAEEAARNAAIARAKDTAGLNSRAAVNALSDMSAFRGIGQGSGLAMAEAGGIVGQAQNEVGEVNRDQLIQALNAARQRTSEAFQGAIAQRGQDISALNAATQARLTARGQNMSMMSPLLGLITARY